MIYGMFFSLKTEISSLSHAVRPIEASATRTAMSVLPNTFFAFSILSCPNLPSSSKPGVSIITTGPRGRISIALETGSVVVPSSSETIESCWPVIAFTRLDLPAFLRPKKLMCVLSPEVTSFNPIKTSVC